MERIWGEGRESFTDRESESERRDQKRESERIIDWEKRKKSLPNRVEQEQEEREREREREREKGRKARRERE